MVVDCLKSIFAIETQGHSTFYEASYVVEVHHIKCTIAIESHSIYFQEASIVNFSGLHQIYLCDKN